jgi:hypothetical protein
MPTFKHQITIEVSAARVFDAVADVKTHLKWQKGLVGSEVEGAGIMSVGKRGVEIRKMFGREKRFSYEVTHFERPKEWGFKAISGPIRPEAVLQLREVGGKTVLESEMKIPGLLGFLLGGLLLKQQKENYVRLKELLEKGQI